MSDNLKESYVKNVTTFGAGLGIRWVVNHWFDYLLYPAILLWLGNLTGGIILTILAIILNVFLIKVYDWTKTDWFLIEKLKHSIESNTGTGWKHSTLKLVKDHNIAVFLILCLDDPITVTLYFRKGSYKYDGMVRRDWVIFLLANVVSNLYWIVGWALVIELVKILVD